MAAMIFEGVRERTETLAPPTQVLKTPVISVTSLHSAHVVTSPPLYTIHATRNDQSVITHRIIPDVAVAQARVLQIAGWRVRISESGGRHFGPAEFDQLLTFDRA